MGRDVRLLTLSLVASLLTVHTALEEFPKNPQISYVLFGAGALIIVGWLLVLLENWRK